MHVFVTNVIFLLNKPWSILKVQITSIGRHKTGKMTWLPARHLQSLMSFVIV